MSGSSFAFQDRSMLSKCFPGYKVASVFFATAPDRVFIIDAKSGSLPQSNGMSAGGQEPSEKVTRSPKYFPSSLPSFLAVIPSSSPSLTPTLTLFPFSLPSVLLFFSFPRHLTISLIHCRVLCHTGWGKKITPFL